MQTLRCLIADIPQKLLSDIVHRMTQQHDRIEVLPQVDSIEQLPAILSRQPVDVLILGLSGPLLPQYCRDILRRYTNLLIIGLIDDGRLAAVFLNNVSNLEIVKLIYTFGGRSTEKSASSEAQETSGPAASARVVRH